MYGVSKVPVSMIRTEDIYDTIPTRWQKGFNITEDGTISLDIRNSRSLIIIY